LCAEILANSWVLRVSGTGGEVLHTSRGGWLALQYHVREKIVDLNKECVISAGDVLTT
jgi:hypothetical protein